MTTRTTSSGRLSALLDGVPSLKGAPLVIVLCLGAISVLALHGRLSARAPAAAESGETPAAAPQAAAVPSPAQTIRAPVPAPEPKQTRTPDAAAERRVREAEARAEALAADNEALRGRLEDMLGWILDNIKGKYPLSERLMNAVRIDPMTDELFVSEDLEELLRLTAAETERLDDVFADARAALGELEAAGITVRRLSDDELELLSPSFDGSPVRSNLYAQVEAALGGPRFGRFLQVAEEGLLDRYGHFGEEERAIRFAVVDDGTGNEKWYIRDERSLPSATGEGRETRVHEEVTDELPAKYEDYLPFLAAATDAEAETADE
jgi:hypothetical protein